MRIHRPALAAPLFGAALVAPALLGCSGPPPRATPPPPPALSTLAPQLSIVKGPAPEKRFIILYTGEEPDTDAVESALARGANMGQVGPSPRGFEIGLPGVLCGVEPTERPRDVPKPFMPSQLQANGLDETEGAALAESQNYLQVSCHIEDADLPVRGLPPAAEAAAEAVAGVANGWIHDPQTGRYYARADWNQSRLAQSRFEPRRSIRVLRERSEDGHYWLGTRGLIAFGKPDLELFPVDDPEVEPLAEQLLVLADLLISEQTVGPGARLTVGPVEALLVPRDAFAATLPPETAGKGIETAGPTVAPRLAVVDPDGRVGDMASHQAFLRRLQVR